MAFFVLHKSNKKKLGGNSLYRNFEGQLCVWVDEDKAIEHANKFKNDWEKWYVRPADKEDFKVSDWVKKTRKYGRGLPLYKVMDSEDFMPAAKRTTSAKLLVDVFEDYEQRRFAVSSKASTEHEFIAELSQALSAGMNVDWNTRLRELLPLVVDMCCKYRGYKAETVQERRELIAGDLDMPRAGT